MNICIIGGSGFIGTYLSKILSTDNFVVNIDKNAAIDKINNFKADITDYNTLLSVFPDNIDVVILLAAEHKDNVSPISLYYDVNVNGTRNVLKVMNEKNVSKIIFTSSVAVYGLNKINPNENSPTDPFNDYGKSKLQAEGVLKEWYNNDMSKTLIIIRPTVVFGPGNKGNVYNLLQQIVNGKFIMIGNGKNLKSMAYVENIVGFIAVCTRKINNGFHLFNYADKPDLSTCELVNRVEQSLNKKRAPIQIPYFIGYLGGCMLDVIGKIVGKKFSVSAVRIKKFCATTQFSSLFIEKIDFKPPFLLIDGLAKTIDSIKKDI